MRKEVLSIFLTIILFFLAILPVAAQENNTLEHYVQVLKNEGKDPLTFVIEKLDSFDLLIFDDAWHPAVEPFKFYQTLVKSPEFYNKVKYVFVEAFPVNKQQYLDIYFNSPKEDKVILYPLFQDDFSGLGWPLKTYFDLLETVYTINQKLSMNQRLKVIAVNAPTYWTEILTQQDLELFRKSLIGNDYTMYKIILDELNNFQSGSKGIFLTNTRHAYKGIKDKNGRFFWNCGTFFHQWHPGKTYSIRFHNMALSIQAEKQIDSSVAKTTSGIEKYEFKWIRLGDGVWDSAFREMGNHPIAFALKNNVFGNEAYVGNHIHKAAPGQTMYDANDAVIFLAPLENLHNSAMVDFIYTDEFKIELARRYRILFTGDQIKNILKEHGFSTIEELINKTFVAEPEELIPQSKTLPSIDAWKSGQ
jgi:hypothetical protein